MGVRYVWQEGPEGETALCAAASALSQGGVAVFPTDTVYGIAQLVDANPQGPDRLFQIKRRDTAKKIPIMIPDADCLAVYGVEVPAFAYSLGNKFWPGGLTLVVRASEQLPRAYISENGTVALRVPGKSAALEIVRKLGRPLAVTSANTSGSPAPLHHLSLEDSIVSESDVIICGAQTGGVTASTIVDCTGKTPVIIREGAVSARDVFALVE